MPNRIRKNANVTLSELAILKGHALAYERGIAFSQLVEQLLRGELRRAGILPAEGHGVSASN